MRTVVQAVTAGLVCISLAACGSTVPDVIVNPRDENAIGVFVNDVAFHIRCELHNAVVHDLDHRNVPWLENWAAEVTLSMTINEKTLLNPGLGLTDTVFNSTTQTVGLALGGNFNQTATRVVSITFYEIFAKLKNEVYPKDCEPPDAPYFEGSLRIEESLNAGIYPASLAGATSNPFIGGGPLKEVSTTITFDVDVGGNVTPSFKFIHVSGNSSGTFLTADRDRKDQLLITMGPAVIPGTKRTLANLNAATPGPSVLAGHDIGRIGLEFQRFLNAP